MVQIIRTNRRDRVPCRAMCRRLAFCPLYNWTQTFHPAIDNQRVPTPCLTDLHLVPFLSRMADPAMRSVSGAATF